MDVVFAEVRNRYDAPGYLRETGEPLAVIVAVSFRKIRRVVLEVEIVHHGQLRHIGTRAQVAVGTDEGIHVQLPQQRRQAVFEP